MQQGIEQGREQGREQGIEQRSRVSLNEKLVC